MISAGVFSTLFSTSRGLISRLWSPLLSPWITLLRWRYFSWWKRRWSARASWA